MNIEFLLLLLIIILGFGFLAYLIRQSSSRTPDRLMGEFLKSFDSRASQQSTEIREQTRVLNERLDNAARVIAAVQKNIGEFTEIGRSMRDLQDFLKSPKLRGNIGEEVLADLVQQMFPRGNFFLQHSFKNGTRVDVAIKTDAGILPIDAKFPMENYQRMVKGETETDREAATKEFVKDIKHHIDDIHQKYILPDEGTLDFALMYVPSESVFYELVCLNDIMAYAKRNRVYPVSPTTLYAHLQTILLSYAGKEIEIKTQQVFKLLRAMVGDYEKIETNIGVLNRHITNAYNQVGQVTSHVQELGRKLQTTQSLKETSEPLPLTSN